MLTTYPDCKLIVISGRKKVGFFDIAHLQFTKQKVARIFR